VKLDLEIISGNFVDGNINVPKNKQYLLKYFQSDIQQQFVRYYLSFGSIEHFVDHTGEFCKRRWLEVLAVRFKKLESTLKEAKKNMDFTTVAEIESGNFVVD